MTIQELEIKTGPGHPWRRFFAYSLDYALYMAIFSFILYYVMGCYPPIESSFVMTVCSLIIYILMIPIDSILMMACRTTAGKFLMGIRITHDSGRNLTFSEAMERNVNRWRYGEGFEIPFFSYYRNWKCYQNIYLDKDGYIRQKEDDTGTGNVVISFSQGPVKAFSFTKKNGKICEITGKEKYTMEDMAFINSRYNVIALYTLAASQEDFHVWNIFALSKFISDYEDNFYNPVYRDSFKNIIN